jgi:TolB-like protein/tetratricopeptide (TPR) repeat protein
MSVFGELKRRQVIKVAAAYAIVSWLLVQIASVLAPALRLPDWVVSLVVLLLILGLPVAVFLAWAYELTPDGVRRTGISSIPESARNPTGRRLEHLIVVLLVATLAFLAIDRYVLEEREEQATLVDEARGPSVAVLPFVSMSGDPEQTYFSEGIAEELLNVLARIPELRVPSRTSSFSFEGTNTPLETIAEGLDVSHVLEGSVRKDGERVRVRVELIDAAANRSLWSETFDRELTSIFEIQDEIAARVAEVLQVRLLGSSSSSVSRTTSADAHDAYLQGLAYVATQASEDIRNAIASFERATELDPQYADAYAMLARSYATARMFDFMDPESATAAARVAVERALELDPLLARAYYERSRLTEDPAQSIEDLQRAAELGLNDSDAHLSRSLVLERLGRYAEARAALEKAVGLDPRSVELNWMMGTVRLHLGDRSGARGYYGRTIDLQPTSPVAYAGMGDVNTVGGRLDESVRWYVTGLQHDPGHPHMTTWVGFLYLALGDEERAARWLNRGAVLLQDRGTARELLSEFVPLARYNRDPERLIRLVQGVSPDLFGPFGSRIFRKLVLPTPNVTAIRDYYEAIWPELFVEEPAIRPYNVDIVPDVAWILRSGGETERANAMLIKALDVVRTNEWAPAFPSDMQISWVEVEILALLGRADEAISALRGLIDDGWRFGWWLAERDPVLASIRDRPQFVAMLNEIRADMAQQLAGMPEYEPPSTSE